MKNLDKQKSIILLDLNFTLVSNSTETVNISDMRKRIEKEQYNLELLDALRGFFFILITARPQRWKLETLRDIRNKTGVMINESYFNEKNLMPAQCKKQILVNYIFTRYGRPEMGGQNYFGIESNPKTRRMYSSFSIDSAAFDNRLIKKLKDSER